MTVITSSVASSAACAYGRALGFHQPFFYKLVAVLARPWATCSPRSEPKQRHAEEVIRVEEEAFTRRWTEDPTVQWGHP